MHPPRLRDAACRVPVVTYGAPPPPPSCSSLPDGRRSSPGDMFFLKDEVTFTTPLVALSFPCGAWCNEYTIRSLKPAGWRQAIKKEARSDE